MNKRFGLAVALCALITGCAEMADGMSRMAGLGVVDEEKSTFDGATIVRMSPAFLYRGSGMGTGMNTTLGARWSSKAPDHVALVLTHASNVTAPGSSYVNFSGMDVNIDGTISEYKTAGLTTHDNSGYNTVSRTIYTKSENAVVVPLVTLESMIAAKDTRLRIHTSQGHEDAVFSIERIPGGQSTAILHLREFMNRVQAQRKR